MNSQTNPSNKAMSSLPPTKYIRVDGVMRLNPEYQRWKEETSNDGPSLESLPSSIALPIVSTMADYHSLNEAVMVEVIPLAESTTATMEMLQEPEICLAAGMSADSMFEQLSLVLSRYEVPMGLMNKLMLLGEYDCLEFMIDDSESMILPTDALDKTGRQQTRWQEAEQRLKEMIEFIAHVPFEKIEIFFLNRSDRITVTRNGRDPATLIAAVYGSIRRAFATPPKGSTPVRERLQESFKRGRDKAVARWIFCDGEPNGGKPARQHVTRLLQNRAEPERNPITLISCTDQDDQVEWMKDAEEIAPYCSESDDYEDERREVLRDQGEALPFNKGFYLVAQLVAAMCPEDLDAMDESVPFTKVTLDNLLGISHNNETYQHYFSSFIDAQRGRKVMKDSSGRPKPSDELKKNFPWKNYYPLFVSTPLARDIPAVQQFRGQLEQMEAAWEKRASKETLPKAKHSSPCMEI